MSLKEFNIIKIKYCSSGNRFKIELFFYIFIQIPNVFRKIICNIIKSICSFVYISKNLFHLISLLNIPLKLKKKFVLQEIKKF